MFMRSTDGEKLNRHCVRTQVVVDCCYKKQLMLLLKANLRLKRATCQRSYFFFSRCDDKKPAWLGEYWWTQHLSAWALWPRNIIKGCGVCFNFHFSALRVLVIRQEDAALISRGLQMCTFPWLMLASCFFLLGFWRYAITEYTTLVTTALFHKLRKPPAEFWYIYNKWLLLSLDIFLGERKKTCVTFYYIRNKDFGRSGYWKNY